MDGLTENLRKRFFSFVETKWWCANTYDTNYKEITNKSGVYFFAMLDIETKVKDILYVGSSVDLKTRYKGHNIYRKMEKDKNNIPLFFYFIEMDKGFYDYERKLIKKLKPKYNTQHKGNKND